MTRTEYNKKLDSYKRSDAPVDVKQAAIDKLNEEYYGMNSDKQKKLLDDIKEGAADISDIKI